MLDQFVQCAARGHMDLMHGRCAHRTVFLLFVRKCVRVNAFRPHVHHVRIQVLRAKCNVLYSFIDASSSDDRVGTRDGRNDVLSSGEYESGEIGMLLKNELQNSAHALTLTTPIVSM